MGININSLESLAQRVGKYVEKCDILQTKPIQVCENSFKGLKLSSLEIDAFKGSNKFRVTC